MLGRYGVSGDHAFGGLQLGYGGYGFDEPKKLASGADFGFAIPLGSSNAALCPQIQTVYQLSERRFGAQQQSLTTSLGASIGRPFSFSPSFSAVPFLQGGLLQRYARISYRNSYAPNGAYSNSHLGGQLGAGFGLRFGNAFMLRPALTVPLGFRKVLGDETEPVYSITASFGLRR